jgi:serine/threonine protein kinase
MLIPNSYIHERYLVVRTIEHTVYEALDMSTRAQVVLKLLAGGGQPAAWPQIEHEAAVLRTLHHPALPTILDILRQDDDAIIVSEYVPGEHLAAAQGAPLSLTQLTPYASQVLGALEYLHQQVPPIFHRGIKPQNIRLTPDGTVKLVDLAPARPTTGAIPARPASSGLGSSLQFMPPEQVQGGALDARSDLYSLAATLYYLSTGTLPALAGKRINAQQRNQPDPLRPAQELNPQLPAQWSDALAQALALEPARRPANADALRQLPGLSSAQPGTEQQVPTLVALPQPAAAQPQPTTLLVPGSSSALRPRWLLPAIISAIGVVLLLVVLVLILLRERNSNTPPVVVQNATAALPQPAATAVTAPTVATSATQEQVDSALPTTGAAVVTAVPRQPKVDVIEPAAARLGVQAITLTMRGSNLDEILAARLVSEAGPPIQVAVLPITAEQASLTIPPLSISLNGEIEYRLEVNGSTANAPAVALRDFIERKPVNGIRPEYSYTNRVATDQTGPYTAMRTEANTQSPPLGVLRNGDEIEILRDDVPGWYYVRISHSTDAAQVPLVGWIERWLIDNQNVPPRSTAVPTPETLVFVGKVYSTPTDSAVQCGTTFASSIYGSVEDERGRGIANARLRITSADGKNVFNRSTGRGGVFSVPGLGCTSWVVRLLSVPNAPNGIRANTVVVRNLNGGQFTAAEVRFKLQP